MGFDFKLELAKKASLINTGAKVYVYGAGRNWHYICKRYKQLVHIDINNFIDGFIDQDTEKQSRLYFNKQVFDLTEIDVKNSVVLMSVAGFDIMHEIGALLSKQGFIFKHSFFFTDIFEAILMRHAYARMMELKNKHKGERCFIIGNGPSLKEHDLNLLENEICFATNRIYLMFDDIKWRPSYYVVADEVIIRDYYEEINSKISCEKFYCANSVTNFDNFHLDNSYYYFLDFRVEWRPYPYDKVDFSTEPSFMYWGATVTYDCLQLAAFMGFSEIYLIGVDNNYTMSVNRHGNLIKKNIQSHFTTEYKPTYFCSLIDITDSAYKAANEYAKQNGIKIYNASRGGKLEEFERIDFDTLSK